MAYRYEDEEEELVSMSLGDHLEELRLRLLRVIFASFGGMILCLLIGKYLVEWLQAPYHYALDRTELDIPLKTLYPAEGFLVYLKVCLIFGMVLAAPYLFYQVWAFIAAGLYRREKRFVHSVAPASAILFVVGVAFFLMVVARFAMLFFIKFDQSMMLEPNWSLQRYTNLILTLMLVFGLAFQMPIAIVFAERFGLVTLQQFGAARRYIILGLVVAAAIATPPDVISQIALAIPLYGLFEGSLLFCRFMRWRQRKAESSDDPKGPTPPPPTGPSGPDASSPSDGPAPAADDAPARPDGEGQAPHEDPSDTQEQTPEAGGEDRAGDAPPHESIYDQTEPTTGYEEPPERSPSQTPPAEDAPDHGEEGSDPTPVEEPAPPADGSSDPDDSDDHDRPPATGA